MACLASAPTPQYEAHRYLRTKTTTREPSCVDWLRLGAFAAFAAFVATDAAAAFRPVVVVVRLGIVAAVQHSRRREGY